MVMQTERKYDITTEKAAVLKGVKPGINLPIFFEGKVIGVIGITGIPSHVEDRKSTRLNSSHVSISYAVFCLKKKKNKQDIKKRKTSIELNDILKQKEINRRLVYRNRSMRQEQDRDQYTDE